MRVVPLPAARIYLDLSLVGFVLLRLCMLAFEKLASFCFAILVFLCVCLCVCVVVVVVAGWSAAQ